MHKKIVSPLNLRWQNLLKLSRSAKAMDKNIENLQKIWTDWVGPEGKETGGRLTKKMAKDFKEYLRASMLSQEAFEGMVPLSRDYLAQKTNFIENQGLPYSPDMIGFSSGEMFENISIMDQGYGKFTVGVHRDAPEKVSSYAEYLEMGTVKQPARPFLGKTFRDWLNERYPDHAGGLISLMNRELADLAKSANTRARNMPDKYDIAKISEEDVL